MLLSYCKTFNPAEKPINTSVADKASSIPRIDDADLWPEKSTEDPIQLGTIRIFPLCYICDIQLIRKCYCTGLSYMCWE